MRVPTRSRQRLGMSSLEAVMATGITVPVACLGLTACVKLCRYYYHTVATLVCWPY